MRIPRIFLPLELAGKDEIEATQPVSHYLLNVLRLKPAAPLILFDGSGGEYRARISATRGKLAVIQLGEFAATNRCSPLRIHLGIGLSRGERMDLVIQKASELGVTEITPLLTERCEVKLKQDRLAKRIEHWRMIAVSAAEQCGRNLLAEIHTPAAINHWLEKTNADCRIVLHPESQTRFSAADRPDSLALLIGPEGGLSDTEVAQAADAGFVNLCLGPRIMRTETAPIAALAVLQHLWGDLGFN